MAMSDPGYELTTDIERIDLSSLGALYEAVGFGTAENYEHRDVTLDKLFGLGTYGFFAIKDRQLIGMIRVLSDDCMCSWVAEICVLPDWQNRGVGRALLDQVCERFSHTPIYADAFKGQENFFTGSGIMPQSKVVACGRAPVQSN